MRCLSLKPSSVTIYFIMVLLSCNKTEQQPSSDLDALADFSFDTEWNCRALVSEIVFTNNSRNAISYRWDFGDSTTSTETNPIKVFQRSGKYATTLVAYATGKIDSITKVVIVDKSNDGKGPKAGFTITRNSEKPNQILISNKSIGGISYVLDFGDANKSSFASGGAPFIEIIHTYPGPGIYTIELIATDSDGRTNCLYKSLDIIP